MTAEPFEDDLDPTPEPFEVLTPRQRRRLGVEAAMRVVATMVVLGTLYYVMPLDRGADAATVVGIGVGCAVLAVLIGWQVRTVTRSKYPGLRAVEALSFSIPLYLLLFATTYFEMARATTTNFTESLTRTDALYFAVTVFTTVGFGDISARSETARLVVTLQMLLNLLLLGVVVRLFLQAVRRNQRRQIAQRVDGGQP
jgi:voltage-gated potassium channel